MLISIITFLSLLVVCETTYTLLKKNEDHFLANTKLYFTSTLKKICQQFYFGLLNTLEDINCTAPLKRDKNYCGQQ